MKQMFKQHLMEETNYTERARLFRQTTTDDATRRKRRPKS
jgi:hypothetical protein